MHHHVCNVPNPCLHSISFLPPFGETLGFLLLAIILASMWPATWHKMSSKLWLQAFLLVIWKFMGWVWTGLQMCSWTCWGCKKRQFHWCFVSPTPLLCVHYALDMLIDVSLMQIIRISHGPDLIYCHGGFQACMTEDRSSPIAAEMLYRSVVGSELPNYEMQAFQSGFKLTCPNGFTFSKVCPYFL